MLSPANPLNGEPMKPLPIPGRQDVVEYLPAGAVAPGRVLRLDRIAAATASASVRPGLLFAFPSLHARCGTAAPIPLAPVSASPLLRAVPSGCEAAVMRLPVEWLGLTMALATALIAAGRGWRAGRRDPE